MGNVMKNEKKNNNIIYKIAFWVIVFPFMSQPILLLDGGNMPGTQIMNREKIESMAYNRGELFMYESAANQFVDKINMTDSEEQIAVQRQERVALPTGLKIGGAIENGREKRKGDDPEEAVQTYGEEQSNSGISASYTWNF